MCVGSPMRTKNLVVVGRLQELATAGAAMALDEDRGEVMFPGSRTQRLSLIPKVEF